MIRIKVRVAKKLTIRLLLTLKWPRIHQMSHRRANKSE